MTQYLGIVCTLCLSTISPVLHSWDKHLEHLGRQFSGASTYTPWHYEWKVVYASSFITYSKCSHNTPSDGRSGKYLD